MATQCVLPCALISHPHRESSTVPQCAILLYQPPCTTTTYTITFVRLLTIYHGSLYQTMLPFLTTMYHCHYHHFRRECSPTMALCLISNGATIFFSVAQRRFLLILRLTRRHRSGFPIHHIDAAGRRRAGVINRRASITTRRAQMMQRHRPIAAHGFPAAAAAATVVVTALYSGLKLYEMEAFISSSKTSFP